jgi:DNA-binding NarL/FixJ family response regulator
MNRRGARTAADWDVQKWLPGGFSGVFRVSPFTGGISRQLRRQACNHRLMYEATQCPRASGEPIRVAVVDDEELFRRGLMMQLALEDDMEVVGEAGDGIAATELAEFTAPEVMLLDVRMPRRTGVEACVAIKAVAPTTRTIMLTASDEEADLYEAVKNGASGYLLKNSSIDEVAQAIRVVADGQSLISPLMAIKLLDEFKQMSRPDRNQVSTPPVSARELEVLKLVSQGLPNREIGKRLFISENTVKNHVRNILEKLQLHSRMDAVMYAMRENLFDVPDG